MRAWEFLIEERIRGPVVTLKSLNDAKLDRQYRERCAQEREPVVSVMYRNLDRDKEWMEAERMRLELEQLRTEIAAQKAELAAAKALSDAADDFRLLDMARAAAEARKTGKERITKLAQSTIRRREASPKL